MGLLSVGLKLARLAKAKHDEKKQTVAGKPPIVPRKGAGPSAGKEPERLPSDFEKPVLSFPAGRPQPKLLEGNSPGYLQIQYVPSIDNLNDTISRTRTGPEPFATFFEETLKHHPKLNLDSAARRKVAEKITRDTIRNRSIVVSLLQKDISSEVIPVLAKLPDGHPNKNVFSSFVIAANRNPGLYEKFFNDLCAPDGNTLEKFKAAVHEAKAEQGQK